MLPHGEETLLGIWEIEYGARHLQIMPCDHVRLQELSDIKSKGKQPAISAISWTKS